MGTTTSLSPKLKMERGSWRRTLVSRMKFFFNGSSDRPGGTFDLSRARRARSPGARPVGRCALARPQRGERDGLVPAVTLRVIQPPVGRLDEVGLAARLVRERRDPDRERDPDLALLRAEDRLPHLLPDPLGRPQRAGDVRLR